MTTESLPIGPLVYRTRRPRSRAPPRRRESGRAAPASGKPRRRPKPFRLTSDHHVPWSCGTSTVALHELALPATSLPVYVSVYTRLPPPPWRVARSCPRVSAAPMVKSTISSSWPGSLLDAELSVKPPSPDRASATPTVTSTGFSLWFGGQRELGVARNVTVGGRMSLLIVALCEAVRPLPFVAEQVTVVPLVSALSVRPSQPAEDAMPDSGSLTSQLTLTAPVYQPARPAGPETFALITGG